MVSSGTYDISNRNELCILYFIDAQICTFSYAQRDTVRVKTKRTPIEVLTTLKDVAFNTLIYRLFFSTSITQLFSQIYTNCFASS